jgi:hypothetical protein
VTEIIRKLQLLLQSNEPSLPVAHAGGDLGYEIDSAIKVESLQLKAEFCEFA